MRSVKSLFVALALGTLGCGSDDAPEPARTDATTRSLIEGSASGQGPATAFDSLPSSGRLIRPDEIMALGYNRGDPEAPLKVIELGDFGCGFCRRFHEESFGTLRTQFIDTGMIEWKFLPFVTGMFPNSPAVTEAAECVLEQSSTFYEALGGMLWERQAEWKESGEPEALVRSWAEGTGVDVARFDTCLAEDRRLPRVEAAGAFARQLGVRGTPTFWIVGYGPLQGSLPLTAFQGIFATLHAEVVAGRGRGAQPGA
jgi:protein-disulfide isomerase